MNRTNDTNPIPTAPESIPAGVQIVETIGYSWTAPGFHSESELSGCVTPYAAHVAILSNHGWLLLTVKERLDGVSYRERLVNVSEIKPSPERLNRTEKEGA